MLKAVSSALVSVLFITPTMLDGLVCFRNDEFVHTRLLMVIGEAFSTSLKVRVGAVPCLWNVYGPTEATVAISIEETERESGTEMTSNVPVGRPLSNSLIACAPRQEASFMWPSSWTALHS